jgi:hypothetical protein
VAAGGRATPSGALSQPPPARTRVCVGRGGRSEMGGMAGAGGVPVWRGRHGMGGSAGGSRWSHTEEPVVYRGRAAAASELGRDEGRVGPLRSEGRVSHRLLPPSSRCDPRGMWAGVSPPPAAE